MLLQEQKKSILFLKNFYWGEGANDKSGTRKENDFNDQLKLLKRVHFCFNKGDVVKIFHSAFKTQWVEIVNTLMTVSLYHNETSVLTKMDTPFNLTRTTQNQSLLLLSLRVPRDLEVLELLGVHGVGTDLDNCIVLLVLLELRRIAGWAYPRY